MPYPLLLHSGKETEGRNDISNTNYFVACYRNNCILGHLQAQAEYKHKGKFVVSCGVSFSVHILAIHKFPHVLREQQPLHSLLQF
jgi:hypothetical protein